MIALRKAVDDYLALRRSLGFKLERTGRLLPEFVGFLERHGARTVTTPLALAWAQQPTDGHPKWWAERLSIVRRFAAHLHALDPRAEIPPSEWRAPVRRATPFLYSEEDVVRLMHAACDLRPRLRAGTYPTLLGLLAVTGMRVGEAIRLDRDDVDWTRGLLVVRDSKFGRSREVPVHPTTLAALERYARLRDRVCPRTVAPAFFVTRNGTRLNYKNVHFTFLRLVRTAGLTPRSTRCRPRIHDLRHTFAVRTLERWYREDADVEARMPRLSTYLGHVAPISTYWYLSAAPELMALAAARLDRATGRTA
jgi:integrase